MFHGGDVAGRDTGTEAGAPPGRTYKRFDVIDVARGRHRINWRGTGLGAHAGRTYKHFMGVMSRVYATGTEAGAPPGQKYKRLMSSMSRGRHGINWRSTGLGAHARRTYKRFMGVMSRVGIRAPRPVPLHVKRTNV